MKTPLNMSQALSQWKEEAKARHKEQARLAFDAGMKYMSCVLSDDDDVFDKAVGFEEWYNSIYII